ncbi:MAG: metallophosphoesterase [Verrucomicrobiae bacterium]|nr:metallophosphoesterase [Verrucomicrobiae bacterium]
MKILAFADIHGRFEKVASVLHAGHKPDVVIVAGDITQFGGPADVDEALRLWRPVAPVLFAVAGNLDTPAIEQHLQNVGISLNARCREVNGVAFYGCSAAPISIGTPYEIGEEEIAARLQQAAAGCKNAQRRVLVTHAPPHLVLDRTHSGVHAGSRAVREFVERDQPQLTICGHIHEAAGQERLGPTLVVNCGPAMRGHYAVIELDGQGCRAELF